MISKSRFNIGYLNQFDKLFDSYFGKSKCGKTSHNVFTMTTASSAGLE